MTSPRFALVPALGHELHVTEWGDPANPALVLWHGLARTGRDFDELAQALSDSYFVLCPDTIGRGFSTWSDNPDQEYRVSFYSQLAEALLDHYNIAKARWIGTSMGGLIGMWMASGPLADRLHWLIINDIGPEIPQDAVDRIVQYAGESFAFDTVSALEDWLRTIYLPFGPASQAFWRRMALTSARRFENGKFTTHYDPRMVSMLTAGHAELTTWDRWDRITLPVHVTWGETSDILTADILQQMQTTGPRPDVSSFSDCGHAPTLSRPDDIERIRSVITRLNARLT